MSNFWNRQQQKEFSRGIIPNGERSSMIRVDSDVYHFNAALEPAYISFSSPLSTLIISRIPKWLSSAALFLSVALGGPILFQKLTSISGRSLISMFTLLSVCLAVFSVLNVLSSMVGRRRQFPKRSSVTKTSSRYTIILNKILIHL